MPLHFRIASGAFAQRACENTHIVHCRFATEIFVIQSRFSHKQIINVCALNLRIYNFSIAWNVDRLHIYIAADLSPPPAFR